MKAIIRHNPRCRTSRATLEMLESAPNVPIEVIEYLKTPPNRERLSALYDRAGMSPRDGLRAKEPLAAELSLADATEAAILDTVMSHPILINRPLVETEKGVRLCRPREQVRDIL